MLKLLLPVDGSEQDLAAVRYAARLATDRPGSTIRLFNVQPPLTGSAASFLGAKPVRQYHEDEGRAALAPARKLLDEAGIPYEHQIAVGDPGEAIAAYASENGFDQIVMSKGRSGALGGLLGSVASDVLQLARIPVTFVPC